MPDDSATHKVIMLTAFSGVDVQLRHSGIEIPHLTARAERLPKSHVETGANLENSGCGPSFACVSAKENQVRAFAEMSEASPEAHPRRNRVGGKNVRANRRRDEKRAVTPGNAVLNEIQILIWVYHQGDFEGQRGKSSTQQMAAVVHLKGESLAEVNIGSGRGNALIADEGASNQP